MKFVRFGLLVGVLAMAGCDARSEKSADEMRIESAKEIDAVRATLSEYSARSKPSPGAVAPDEIVAMSVVDLANAIKTKRVTSEQATAAFLQRDLELNPRYNAIVTYNLQAMDRARNPSGFRNLRWFEVLSSRRCP